MRGITTFFFLLISLFPQLKVENHFPGKNELGILNGINIELRFNNPLDVNSITDTTFMVYGRWTGVHSGEISFEQNNSHMKFRPDNPFNAGETVTVSLSKNILDSSGSPMETGFTFQFVAKSGEGTLQLTEDYKLSVRNRNEERIQVYGAFAGDLNEDGYTDFTVPNELSNDIRVFINDGSGKYGDFTQYKLDAGSEPSTNEGADFNLDGHIDFAVGNAHNDYVSVFFGDGKGKFVSQDVYNIGHQIRGLTVMDLDGDGFPDIVTANRNSNDVILMRNNGSGKFDEIVSIDANTQSETACMAGDANGDGISDLFVGSHQGEELCLLLGDGKGNLIFSDKVDAGGRSWMIASGDVNGDGYSDVVSANSYDNNFSVALSNGDGTLADADVYPSGQFPLAIDLGDLDGDNDLDLALSNFSSRNFEFYENDGEGNFTLVNQLPSPAAGSCAVLHDRDNDGDLDMTGIDEIEDVLILFVNDPSLVDVEMNNDLPSNFLLHQNYPNPFNPSTTISYSLPYQSSVELIIYDIMGREIKSFINSFQIAGYHKMVWDGTNGTGKKVASGIYLYKLKAISLGNSKVFEKSCKLIFVK